MFFKSCKVPKLLILILISVFLLVLGTFISGTILTPYAEQLGATWFQIGILSGGMYAVRFFVGTPVGRLSDRKGPLTVLKYSLILYPIIAIAYWSASNIYFLLGARFLHGIASAMMLPVAMAYIGQISPGGMEGRYMSLYNASVLIASGIGPFISSIITDYYNDYKVTFLSLFAFSLAALLIVLLLGKEGEIKSITYIVDNPVLNRESKIKEARNTSNPGRALFLLTNKRLMALGFMNIALAVISSLVGFFIVPYLIVKDMGLLFIGSIIAVYNIVSGVAQVFWGKLTDKYDKFYMVLIFGIISACSLFIIPLLDNILFVAVAMVITALASSAVLSAASALSTLVGRDTGMGSTMGFLSTFNSIGMVAGCISLSLVPEIGFSYNWFFYLASIVIIINVILFTIYWLAKAPTGILNIKGGK